MAADETVRIDIDVDSASAVAQLEAVRQELDRLSKENDKLTKAYQKQEKEIQKLTKVNQRTKRDNDMLGNSMRGAGRAAAMSTKRFAGLTKEVFAFRKDAGKLIGLIGKLIGLVNKLALFEIPAFAAAMVGISALFKSGTFFIKMYRAAMTSLASGVAVVGVALTTAVAALREFQSVQFAPMYVKGAENTGDRFLAASQAMSMFVDSAAMAAVSSQDLTKAFATLSKQAPVTPKVTAAFEGLMNVIAGSGGDMGTGAQNLAAFFAKVQKSGLSGAGAEAEQLGPDFQKILKEAKALGIDTQEEFFKAAAEGTLGETFQTKYAGQLDAVNATLVGKFKAAFVDIKKTLGDIGVSFLGPVGDAVIQIETIIKRGILQMAPLIHQFGINSAIGGTVDLIDKATNKLVVLMTKYLQSGPGIIDFFGKVFSKIGSVLERIQDWSRQFEDAGNALIENFVEPVWGGLVDKFGGGMHTLNDLILSNGPIIRAFADQIVAFISAVGDYGNMIKVAFIDALPAIGVFIGMMTKMFNLVTKIANTLLQYAQVLGVAGRALVALPVLYAALVLFKRFFNVFGKMFGKDMSIKANNVYVNGRPVGGAGGGMFGRGGPRPSGGRDMGFFGRSVNAFRGGRYGAMAAGATRAEGMRAGARAAGTALSRQYQGSALGRLGAGNVALSLIGAGLMAKGSQMGGDAGTAVSGLGMGTTAASTALMMGASGKQAAALGTVIATDRVGTASISAIQDIGGGGKYGNADMSGKLGLAAASAGIHAAGFAAAGALVGGPIGAAAGAIIGTIYGGIKGYVMAGKHQKAAKEAAEGMVDKFTEETDKAFAAGDIEGLVKAREELAATHQANLENLADQAEYAKRLAEQQAVIDKLDNQIETYTKNVTLAERALGVNSDTMNRLAEAAGVDLKNSLLNFEGVIRLVGKTAFQQAQLIRQAWSQLEGTLLQNALSPFEKYRQNQQNAASVLASEQAIMGGVTTDDAMMNYIEDAIKFDVGRLGTLEGLATSRETLLARGKSGALGLTGDKLARFNEFVDMALNPQQMIQNLSPEDQKFLADITAGSGLSQADAIARITQGMGQNSAFLANLRNAQTSGDFVGVQTMLGINRAKGPADRIADGNIATPSATINAEYKTDVNISVSGVMDAESRRHLAVVVAEEVRRANERE